MIQATPTKISCKNQSKSFEILLSLPETGSQVIISKNSSNTNVAIPSSEKSIQILPMEAGITRTNSGNSYYWNGNPVSVQKNKLKTKSGKYDITIKTVITGNTLKLSIYSLGVKLKEASFKKTSFTTTAK